MSHDSPADWIRLDFEHARAKHLLFKARLRSLLYGAEVDENPVVSHTACTVGQWIYGRGLVHYGHVPQMRELEENHRDLHVEAARLVDLFKAGKARQAQQELPAVEQISERVHELLSVIEGIVRTQGLPNAGTVAPQLNVDLSELQELLRLNEDLDQRIKAQAQALLQTQERFELVARAAQDAIWDWNLQTGELWWNEEYYRLYGQVVMENKAPNFETWSRRIHPEDRERVVGQIQEVIQRKGSHWSSEYRFSRDNGTYAFVFDRGYALYDEEGQPCRMLGSMQDISERKAAEAALTESEERLRKVLTIETVGVIFFDLDGGIHDANAAFERLSGYTRGDLASGRVRWSELTPPEFWDVTMKSKEELQIHGQNTPYEKQYIRPDGSRWWGLFAGKRVSESECVEFVVDITESKQTEEELERKVGQRTHDLESLNHELLRTNQNLEEFAYAASHDLKEPIRKIHFFADRLRQLLSGKLSPQEQRYFERMEQASNRMSTLIDDLLLYSHVSRGAFTEERVDLNKKLNLVLEDLELEIEQKGARIEADPLPLVAGHKRQLQQLFQNLIGNALKYSRPGVSPRIEIRCTTVDINAVPFYLPAEDQEKRFYRITIRDNGIGFDQADAERIFNVFTRLHGISEYRGTGIGLSIVRKVVENHGGYVWAESHPGAGSAFHVALPVPGPAQE